VLHLTIGFAAEDAVGAREKNARRIIAARNGSRD
tara:strand:- start:33906 stop:34007 length:102 start_codon:yes stop_codon:yes gene_type:complete